LQKKAKTFNLVQRVERGKNNFQSTKQGFKERINNNKKSFELDFAPLTPLQQKTTIKKESKTLRESISVKL
jgi:hypothetical protein